MVKNASGNIAVFRNAEDEIFALHDKCPHKGGPLSQGIVHGRKVACPLHNWNIGLADGSAQGFSRSRLQEALKKGTPFTPPVIEGAAQLGELAARLVATAGCVHGRGTGGYFVR